MAEIDTSIYKVAPTDPMTTVGNALSIANTAQQNRLGQIQLQSGQMDLDAKRGIGDAYQQSIDENGNFDPAGFARRAAQGPARILGPANTTGASQASTAASTAAGTKSDVNQKQSSDALGEAAALVAANVASGNIKGTRKAIVDGYHARLHSGNLTQEAYDLLMANLPPDDKGAAAHVRKLALGRNAPTTLTEPAQAAVDPNTGQPIQKTKADVGAAAAQPGGTKTGLGLGAGDVIAKNQTLMQEDQQRATTTMANLRPLQAALPLIQQLGPASFGTGSADFAKAKSGLIAAGIVDANTSDLQVREEVNKKLKQYAAGAQQAGRSDAALSAALGSNPNLDLTQPANLALVKSQIGLDRMDAAIQKGYQTETAALAAAGKPVPTYSDYKSSYYQDHDQRAFNLDTMEPAERAALYKSLGPKNSPAYQKFAKSYNLAKSAGMLTPAGGQ